MQQTATTPLLNKLKPPLCTAVPGGGTAGGVGGWRERGSQGTERGRGVYCTPRRDCGDFINFYTTAARRTSRSEQRRNGAQTSTPTQTAK